METFYDHIISESNKINEIITEQRSMTPLSPEQLEVYKKTTVCGNCGEGFTHKNHKVMHHNHVDGSFMFAACNSCNLQLKPKKCRPRNVITSQKMKRRENITRINIFYQWYFTTLPPMMVISLSRTLSRNTSSVTTKTERLRTMT